MISSYCWATKEHKIIPSAVAKVKKNLQNKISILNYFAAFFKQNAWKCKFCMVHMYCKQFFILIPAHIPNLYFITNDHIFYLIENLLDGKNVLHWHGCAQVTSVLFRSGLFFHVDCRWIVDMEGAPGTLYEGEKFQLLFKFSSRYPFDSPQVMLM